MCQRGRTSPDKPLFTGRRHGDFVCVFQDGSDDDGGSAGWVLRSRLRALPVDHDPNLDAWVAHWQARGGADDTITITRHGSALAARGNAYWPAADPPLEQFPGGANLGAMSGHAVPAGNVLTIGKATECLVVMHLVGSTLIVHDNGQCGGMNVRFDGFYSKGRGSGAP